MSNATHGYLDIIPSIADELPGIIHALLLDMVDKNERSSNIVGKLALVLLVGAVLGYLMHFN